jgi:hypothetical protein
MRRVARAAVRALPPARTAVSAPGALVAQVTAARCLDANRGVGADSGFTGGVGRLSRRTAAAPPPPATLLARPTFAGRHVRLLRGRLGSGFGSW